MQGAEKSIRKIMRHEGLEDAALTPSRWLFNRAAGLTLFVLSGLTLLARSFLVRYFVHTLPIPVNTPVHELQFHASDFHERALHPTVSVHVALTVFNTVLSISTT